MVDFLATERHFADHLRPVWTALPASHRGAFLTHRASMPISDRPTVVASFGDLNAARGHARPVILMEHGAGQTYRGQDGRLMGHTSYAGGRNRAGVVLLLTPGPAATSAYQEAGNRTPLVEVGVPKMDPWHRGDLVPTPTDPPTIAVSFHWDCLPGDALVSGPPVIGSVARWYEGEVVVVRTAAGDVLTCTPNHPVLTPSGWVAAGLLHEGGHVVRAAGGQGMMQGVDPHQNQAPALIEDVARAFDHPSAVVARSVPVAAEDFHGDGRGSQVAVVRAHRLLGDGVQPAVAQQVGEDAFGGADLHAALLAGDRAAAQFVEGGPGPLDGSAGGRGHGGAFVGRHGGHAAPVGPAAVGGQAVVAEPSVQDLPGGADFGRQVRDAFAAFVPAEQFAGGVTQGVPVAGAGGFATGADAPPDASDGAVHGVGRDAYLACEGLAIFASGVSACQIVSVERRAFVGHVYNLQTRGNWYVANRVVVHNCMVAPETRSAWARYLPAFLDLHAQGWRILGHAHPRIARMLRPRYEAAGVEFVPDFDSVLHRASVYACDNSSTMYEFASTGRPVVVLNHRIYRRDVHHGLRFWQASHLGPHVDHPEDVRAGVRQALRNTTAARQARADAVAMAYAHTDGHAADRAAQAIVDAVGP